MDTFRIEGNPLPADVRPMIEDGAAEFGGVKFRLYYRETGVMRLEYAPGGKIVTEGHHLYAPLCILVPEAAFVEGLGREAARVRAEQRRATNGG